MERYDIAILGGGLAGLTAAIHLARQSYAVVLFEKHAYPHHKVCGEYVSNEVLAYLNHLGVDVQAEGAVHIERLQLSTPSGKGLEVDLPLGGFGMSRYHFDHLLYQRANALGVTVRLETVNRVDFEAETFTIGSTSGGEIRASLALGAFGKRSLLDKKLARDFLRVKSPWLGVKCHYEHPDFPEDLVALHSFKGGYGGLSKTETGQVNFCYLATYASFQRFGDHQRFEKEHLRKQLHLPRFFEAATPVFESPLSIAQISFAPKKPVEGHLLMVGDSAGLIHPLCGNGMAMAIHSAKLAAECCTGFLEGITDRATMENDYTQLWQQHFSRRLRMGRGLQRLLLHPFSANLALHSVARSKKFVQTMIRQTHGSPILV